MAEGLLRGIPGGLGPERKGRTGIWRSRSTSAAGDLQSDGRALSVAGQYATGLYEFDSAVELARIFAWISRRFDGRGRGRLRGSTMDRLNIPKNYLTLFTL